MVECDDIKFACNLSEIVIFDDEIVTSCDQDPLYNHTVVQQCIDMILNINENNDSLTLECCSMSRVDCNQLLQHTST